MMKNFDINLGKPLPEKSYGGNCRIYDPDVPDNPFHYFWVNISLLSVCCDYVTDQSDLNRTR